MPFFQFRNLSKKIEKKLLEKELRLYGRLKFVSIKEDQFNSTYNFAAVNYIELNDGESLKNFCVENKIRLIDKDNALLSTKNNNDKKIYQEKEQDSIFKSKVDIYNPSFYFYKDEAYGKDIENYQLKNNYNELFKIKDAKHFDLTTIYPGLLVGSGYNHPKLKEDKDDFQLGFFFDHTTGLPLISGSSIKGMLKSVISNQEFMDDVYNQTIPLEIFEDNKTIFYDAFILSTKNQGNKIFGSDYITSHYSDDEEWGEFKNPNPIKFLKILPNVTFQFQFQCDEKYMSIFKEIILDFGLGAKTNTGYGKFIEA